jgi:ribosomal protein L13E
VAARAGEQVVATAKTATAPPPIAKEETAVPTVSKNEQKRIARALETLEQKIAGLEKRVAQAGEAVQVASASQDFGAIQEKSIEYAALEAELNTLIHEWEKMVSE